MSSRSLSFTRLVWFGWLLLWIEGGEGMVDVNICIVGISFDLERV